MEFSFSSKALLIDALTHLGVSDNCITTLDEKSTLIHVKSGNRLISPDQIDNQLYYVLSGGFVCRYIDEDAEVFRTINFYFNELHPVMACIDSYFTQTKTQCELKAIADSLVLSIQKNDIDSLIAEDSQLKFIFDTLLIKALTEENDLKLKIIAFKPDALYQYLFKNYPIVIQKVPSKYIAELLGISAEWLSKLKAKQKQNSKFS